MVGPVVLPGARIPLPMEQIEAFCRKWNLVEFSLFGSVLRDDFGPESDVDVLVSFAPDARPTLLTLGAMEIELEKIFGREVDVLERPGVEQSLNRYRRQSILSSAKVIAMSRSAQPPPCAGCCGR